MARSLHRYSGGAIALHWLIALLIALNIYQGLAMDDLKGTQKGVVFNNHETVGIAILLLSLARIAWRLMNPPPVEAPGRERWEKALAKLVHWGFYFFMIAMPITGWLAVSANPTYRPILLLHNWGLPGIPWPHLPGLAHMAASQKRAIQDGAWTVHDRMVWGGYALIALHLAGVAKHQFVGRSPVLHRMLPFLKSRSAA